MRLFIAIKLNEETRSHTMGILNKLESCSNKGNFTPKEKLHITLVFLGETQVNRIEEITSAINSIEEKAFCISLSQIGVFNMGRKGPLYWLGVAKNKHLIAIREQLYKDLKQKGFELQNRKFKPHITLGRNVKISNQKAFLALKHCAAKNKFKFRVDSICLYNSERTNGETHFTEIFSKILI